MQKEIQLDNYILTIENVNNILHKIWNPIGFGVPIDEYMSYSNVVFLLLKQKVPKFMIKNYLMYIEVSYIGLVMNKQRFQILDKTLDELYKLIMEEKNI
jgi:hypothetical protein